MVGRQVDKVILFPSKRGSKCGKMDKKEAPDAEALTPPRPAFCLFVCEVEPLRRKVGVTHGVQLNSNRTIFLCNNRNILLNFEI